MHRRLILLSLGQAVNSKKIELIWHIPQPCPPTSAYLPAGRQGRVLLWEKSNEKDKKGLKTSKIRIEHGIASHQGKHYVYHLLDDSYYAYEMVFPFLFRPVIDIFEHLAVLDSAKRSLEQLFSYIWISSFRDAGLSCECSAVLKFRFVSYEGVHGFLGIKILMGERNIEYLCHVSWYTWNGMDDLNFLVIILSDGFILYLLLQLLYAYLQFLNRKPYVFHRWWCIQLQCRECLIETIQCHF